SVDASNQSPADVAEAITVGATTSTDVRAGYSNFGPLVDLFAPGSGITSDWYTNDTATAVKSGTSMATPHVTGVAALYVQAHPTATPATVASAIINAATPGVVGNPGSGSPNLLLYSLFGVSNPPSVTVTAPMGGDKLFTSLSSTIQWTANASNAIAS